MHSARIFKTLRSRNLTAWLVASTLVSCGAVHGEPPIETTRSIAVADDTSSDSEDYIDVTIPAVDGKVQWTEVAKMAAESMTLDEQSVSRLLPKGELNLESPLVSLILTGINVAAEDSISMQRVLTEDGQRALRVRCRRRLTKSLSANDDPIGCVCDWDTDLAARSRNRPIVIGLHGYQGEASSWADFRTHLRALGYATGTVQYDFDQSVANSARQVAMTANEELNAAAGSLHKIVLIGHSMGGLVAREWAENPELPNRNIVALVTLGSPHAGSNWATMPPLSDVFTGHEFSEKELIEFLLHQPSSAGLNDLVPDSKFLQNLASRPRRADVEYLAVIGTKSLLEEADVAVIRGTLRSMDREGSVMRLIRPRIQPLLGSFDELSDGKGDGMVACDSACIPGCDNTIKLPVTHLGMVRPEANAADDAPNPVWDAVTEFLSRLNR